MTGPQFVLFDWGDTVMRAFPDVPGPMEFWLQVEAIPGVRDAIIAIRHNAAVCLATNAADSGEHAIRRALARVDMDGLFDRVFCNDVVGYRKPSQAFFTTILVELNTDSENVFMVGDEFETDVLGAVAAGIRAVWVNLASTQIISGAGYTTVNSYASLLGALESLGFRTNRSISGFRG